MQCMQVREELIAYSVYDPQLVAHLPQNATIPSRTNPYAIDHQTGHNASLCVVAVSPVGMPPHSLTKVAV